MQELQLDLQGSFSLCQLQSLSISHPPVAEDGDEDAGQHPELHRSPSPKPQPCTKPPLTATPGHGSVGMVVVGRWLD